MQSAIQIQRGYGNLHTLSLTPLPFLAQSRLHRVRPIHRSDNTHKILRAHQTLERPEHGHQESPIDKLPEYPCRQSYAYTPGHAAPAYRISQHPADTFSMFGYKGHFLRFVLRFPAGCHTQFQILPGQQHLTPKPGTLHYHTQFQGTLLKGDAPPFKRNGHATVQQRVRTLHFYQLLQPVIHTLTLLVRGLYFRRRQSVFTPLIRQGIRIEHAVGLRAVRRHRHLQCTLDLRRFRKCQLTAQIGEQRRVGHQDALTRHKGKFPGALHHHRSRGGGPTDRIFLRHIGALVMKGTAKQLVQVLVIHLDHVERRRYAAVRLGDDQHRGTGYLFRLDFRRLRLLAAQVKGAFLDVAHDKILIFHGTDAVHEILIRHLSFVFELILPLKRISLFQSQNHRRRFERGLNAVLPPLRTNPPFPPRLPCTSRTYPHNTRPGFADCRSSRARRSRLRRGLPTRSPARSFRYTTPWGAASSNCQPVSPAVPPTSGPPPSVQGGLLWPYCPPPSDSPPSGRSPSLSFGCSRNRKSTGQSPECLQLPASPIALRRRAISRLVEQNSFLVARSSSRVSFNSFFNGSTILSINIRVACSVLSIRTVSASALAFSASAFALRTVAFSVRSPMTAANKPPPSTRLSISLSSISDTCLCLAFRFLDYKADKPLYQSRVRDPVRDKGRT
nr:MAG TPA: hypothetical protein [Caudoviricetes sp.]